MLERQIEIQTEAGQMNTFICHPERLGYFGCAETDRYAPPEMIDALRTELEAKRVKAEVEIYPGMQHGFAFPQRPVYNKPAAERYWERLFALFGDTLRSARP
jgi:dienelactone hydrolase